MPDDLIFRAVTAVILTTILSIRAYYHHSAQKLRGKFVYRESKRQVTLKSLLAIFGITTLLLYLIYPDGLTWATLPWPTWLRWLGAGAGILAIGLHFYVHRTLGENFSQFLHIREQHRLVSNGPYRWVRHPMYTAFYITTIAWILLSANWFVALTWTIFALVVTRQVEQEEAMMLEKFGNEYRRYIKSTGRFLPRPVHLREREVL